MCLLCPIQLSSLFLTFFQDTALFSSYFPSHSHFSPSVSLTTPFHVFFFQGILLCFIHIVIPCIGQWFSPRAHGGHLAVSRDILVTSGKCATSIQQIEFRNIAKHTCTGQLSHKKRIILPQVSIVLRLRNFLNFIN